MDSRLSPEVVRCRQFDPVSGPFSMSNEHKDDAVSVYTVGSQKNLVPIRSRYAYFKKRKHVSSLLVIVLYFLVGVLFLIVIILSILYALARRGTRLCDSEDCVRIAASFKESMDPSVDPCDDFYAYTCGRWPKQHPMPDTSLTNTWFSERSHRVSRTIRDLLKGNITDEDAPWAVRQAKKLFDSCLDVRAMDRLGLAPLFELLKQLKLPAIPAGFTGESGDYVEQIALLKRVLGRDVFFAIDVGFDPRNRSRNVMYFDTPDTSSPLPGDKELEKRLQSIRSRLRRSASDVEDDDSEDDEEKEQAESVELSYMTEIIREVVSNGTVDVCDVSNDTVFPSERQLRDVVKSIYTLSETVYFLAREEGNRTITEDDLSDDYYMLVDDLQRVTDEYVVQTNSSLKPRPIWRPFVERLFEGVAKLDLDDKDRILVANLDYLKDIALVLASTDEVDLENYIWWIVVDIVAPHCSGGMRRSWTNYIDTVVSVEVTESKSLRCASAVNGLMGMAVSWLFVDRSFHENKGPRVLEMLEDIRQAFNTLVDRTDWMDGATKRATLEKNRRMSSVIGHPMWLFEEGALDEYYEGINLTETEYLSNMIQITRLISKSELECIHDVNHDNESYWATDPTDVNAFHTFQANQITRSIYRALNYGAIGTILGHELTHGFDNSGRQYDSHGNLRQWWSNETVHEYTDRTQCFIDHYSSYYEDEVKDHVDGELTLGENIADNGGLREAVIAYERWKARHGQEPLLPGFAHLTHEQLLFLSFAHMWCESYTATSLKWMLQDSHSPGHVRLRAVLRNSREFGEAWKCPVGSNMNPAKKCHLW